MRIGIDLDDTMCRTTEIVHQLLEKEAKKNGEDSLDIMNNELKREDFFKKYYEEIYENAEIKRSVADVIRRLHNKGNEIYIITAREEKFNPITRNWLEKHNVLFDEIIASVYGDRKAEACKKNKIDLMIDDDPYNYQRLKNMNIGCILFDDRGRYEIKEEYATTWKEIENYIERNR